MSLSEFMPYGAPELIEGAAPRMARSTMLASALVAAMVWSAGLLGAGRHEVVVPIVPPIPGDVLLPPPPREKPAAPEPHVKPAPAIDPAAMPVPVPDAPSVEPAFAEPGFQGSPPASTGGDERGADRSEPGGDFGVVPPFVDQEPELVRSTDPVYPDFAREAGIEGTVRVWMLVGLNGRVERAVLAPDVKASLFDDAALAAARTCVFTPALSNKHPVKVWVARAYRFKLH